MFTPGCLFLSLLLSFEMEGWGVGWRETQIPEQAGDATLSSPPWRVIMPPLSLLPPPQLLLSAGSFLCRTLSGSNFGRSSVSQKSRQHDLSFLQPGSFSVPILGITLPVPCPKAHSPEDRVQKPPLTCSHLRAISLFPTLLPVLGPWRRSTPSRSSHQGTRERQGRGEGTG